MQVLIPVRPVVDVPVSKDWDAVDVFALCSDAAIEVLPVGTATVTNVVTLHVFTAIFKQNNRNEKLVVHHTLCSSGPLVIGRGW